MNDQFSDQQLTQLRGVVVQGIGEALEQIVLPRLVTIEDTIEVLKTDVGVLKTDVGTLKNDVGSLKIGQLAQAEQLDRIERKVNTTITTTDHLEIRVKNLETKLSV